MLKGLRVEFYANLFNILNDISVTLGKKYSLNKKKPTRVSRIDYSQQIACDLSFSVSYKKKNIYFLFSSVNIKMKNT